MLGHGGGADIEVLRQFFQLRHGCGGRHQPAQAPAGHAEVLGKAVEHEGVVIHLQHAVRVRTVGQAVVDLVNHQVTAACARSRGQGRQLVAAQQRSGRIGRRRHQGAYTVRIPVTFQQFSGQLITRLRANRHQLCRAFDQSQEMPVAGIARIGQQPVLAGIDQQAAGQQ